MKSLTLVIRGLALMSCLGAPARAEHPHGIVALASRGFSVTLRPHVRNAGSPTSELRYGWRGRPWLEPDAGLALIAFPEQVLEFRPGFRFYPLALWWNTAVVRDVFVRPSFQLLLVSDGFDWAPAGEVGMAPEWKRAVFYLSFGVTRYVERPRLTGDLRFGVGLRF